MKRDDDNNPKPCLLRLALCVDDFGLHDGVNRAVFALAEAGRLNAVSCMVGAPAWQAESATRLAALAAGRIDLGLHLDFTEWPLRAGSRRSLPRLIAEAYAGRLDAAALDAEVAAQFDAFEQHTGRAPDYVDGHQHVHQLPLLRDALLAALARRYPAQLPWLRSTRAAAGGIKPKVIAALGGSALRRAAQRRGHALNGRLLGVHDFRADPARYHQLLQGWLKQARDGDLLMCHPAAPTDAPIDDALLPSRHSEFEVLNGDSFDTLLATHRIQLAPISRIAVAGKSA